MLCNNAVELLRELQRDTWLPHYNNETIRIVLKEIAQHFDDIVKLLDTMPANEDERKQEDVCQVLAQHTTLERNKRCLLAYIKYRADELLKIKWECGTSVLPSELKEKLCTQEVALMTGYDDLLAKYQESTGVTITDDLEPPKSTKITIRVLENCGVLTDEGWVELAVNTMHHLRRSDVQDLIRQGSLQHIP
mmetsp:Transcript_33266/g.64932  ORF Transcript_33266/g.64932 Transcript_33266/m.64932 type:complete len:192 (+) Transcript_33266:248-823(+)